MKFRYCNKCLTMTPRDSVTSACMLCNKPKRDIRFWAKKYDKVKHIPHRRGVGGGVECNKYGGLLGNNYATTDMPICVECQRNKNKSR